ncbi:MAG: hypothetical protein OEM62_06140, partial [Acidobacteriota bacterium]|nr:hypothetical protein [Acidobacteriota bacterium]
KNLRYQVSTLRKLLEPDREARAPGAAIETTAGMYRLSSSFVQVDSRDFEKLVETAAAVLESSPAVAVGHLDEALALWRGDVLADFRFEDFSQLDITRLDALKRRAHEMRLEALLATGAHAEILPELEMMTTQYRFHEGFWRLRMIALYRANRQADALAAFREARGILGDELGLEPSRELVALEEKILLQDPTLDAVPEEVEGAVIHNLPRDPSTFIGRDVEMATVRRMLREHRVVTLTGAGGTGKTRLAIESAWSLLGRFQAGIWFIDLTELPRGQSIHDALARALGIRDQPGRNPIAAIADFVADGDALLVVDNCEHVIDQAREALATLVALTPKLRVLATSREALGIRGEARWRLPALTVPAPESPSTSTPDSDAVMLFNSRASMIDPALDLGGERALLVAELCRRLDGLPLAIELAAARLATFPLDEIVSRLGERELLSADSRSVPERHRTLTATIAWSFELLAPAEQDLFLTLSVFDGGFTSAAAEQVHSDVSGVAPPAVFALLARLVDCSLVEIDRVDPPRHRLLDTVRQFAASRVESDLSEVLEAAHMRYFVKEAETGLRLLNQDTTHVRVLARNLPNFRAAMRHAIEGNDGGAAGRIASALDFFWLWTGRAREGRRWAEDAVAILIADESISSDDPASAIPHGILVATVERSVGFLASIDRDYGAAEEFLERSADRFGAIAGQLEIALKDLDAAPLLLRLEQAALRGKAWSIFHHARMITAQVFAGIRPRADSILASHDYDECTALLIAGNHSVDLAYILPFAGWNEVIGGEPEGAATLQEARRLADRLSLEWPHAVATANLGLALSVEGQFAAALSHLNAAAGVLRRVQDLYSLQITVTLESAVAAQLNDFARAFTATVEAARIMRIQGDREWEALTGGVAVVCLHEAGKLEEARAVAAWLDSTTVPWGQLVEFVGVDDLAARRAALGDGPSATVQTPADAAEAARLIIDALAGAGRVISGPGATGPSSVG